MKSLVWLLIRRIYLVPTILVFTVTLGWTWQMLHWRYGVWTSTSFTAYSTLQVAGPVLAGGAAWAAVRLATTNALTSLPSLPRAETGSIGLHVMSGIGCLVSGYVAGLLPVFGYTVLTASGGSPGPLQLLNGLVSAAALVCVGYALGRLLPWIVVPPLVAAAVFLALGYALEQLEAATPARDHLPTVPWIVENPAVLASQAALYALLALASLWAVVVFIRLHRSTDWRRHTAGGAVAAAPLLLLPVFAAWDPLLQRDLGPDQLPSPVCSSQSTVPVCVHPALQQDLPEATAVLEELVHWYGGEMPTDAGRFEAGTTSRLFEPGPLYFDMYPSIPLREYIMLYAPSGLAGMHACYQKYPRDDGSDPTYVTPEPFGVSGAVAAWLTQRMAVDRGQALVDPGSDRGAEYLGRLSRLPDDQVRAWIRDHRDQLFRCTVKADALP